MSVIREMKVEAPGVEARSLGELEPRQARRRERRSSLRIARPRGRVTHVSRRAITLYQTYQARDRRRVSAKCGVSHRQAPQIGDAVSRRRNCPPPYVDITLEASAYARANQASSTNARNQAGSCDTNTSQTDESTCPRASEFHRSGPLDRAMDHMPHHPSPTLVGRP
jgi:hypothetical protein